MKSSLKFGTSGLRGLVTELSDVTCARYAAAFVHHLKSRGIAAATILIGEDLRASSPRIARACAAGAKRAGVDSISCGALPTPALALEAMQRGLPAIMVTGSHIPDDRNGLKFYLPDGEITKADEAGIAAALDADGNDSAPSEPAVTAADHGALERYIARYADLAAGWSLAGMRIGVYQHSSVGRDVMVRVLEALGATCLPFGRADGFVPVDTEALRPEDVALASDFAAREAIDAIVSTDGDADRPLISDGKGRFLRGDMVGLLTAEALGADAVVTPVTSSTAIEASGRFGSIVRTRVGSPHVIAGIETALDGGAKRVVGFEANGGVLLGSDTEDLSALPTRDALLPIVAVLALANRRGTGIAGLVADLPARYTASDRLQEIPGSASGAWLDALATDMDTARAVVTPRGALRERDTTDGVRLCLENGDIVHFRASGNAPELRCYTESDTQGDAEALLAWGLATARGAVMANS